MHYRSYGGSTGTPSERALVADAQRLFEMVAKDHPRIVVIGRSLGSGIAIQVAAGNRIERLVLVTPYDSIAALAADRFRWFPVRLLLRDRYESWRYASRIGVPTTLVIAGRDEVIPNESSLRLAATRTCQRHPRRLRRRHQRPHRRLHPLHRRFWKACRSPVMRSAARNVRPARSI